MKLTEFYFEEPYFCAFMYVFSIPFCTKCNVYEESKIKLGSNFSNIFMTPEIVSNFDHMVEIRRSGSTHNVFCPVLWKIKHVGG